MTEIAKYKVAFPFNRFTSHKNDGDYDYFHIVYNELKFKITYNKKKVSPKCNPKSALTLDCILGGNSEFLKSNFDYLNRVQCVCLPMGVLLSFTFLIHRSFFFFGSKR